MTPLEQAQQELASFQAQLVAVEASYQARLLQLPVDFAQRKAALEARIAKAQQQIDVLQSE
jgi:hypothetical protein